MMQELWADAIGNMDSDLVERFVLMEQGLEEKKPVKVIAWKKWSLIAACLLLAVGIGTGGALQYLKRTEPAPTLPTPSVEVPGVETPPENDVDEDQSPFDVDYSYEEYLDFVTSKACLDYRNGFVTYEKVSLFGEFDKMNLWGYSYTGAEVTYFLNDRGRSVELLIDPYKSLYDLPEQEITDAGFEDCDMRRIVYTEQYQPKAKPHLIARSLAVSLNLRQEVVRSHDRTSHQLRKEGEEKEILEPTIGRFDATTIDIDDVADRLEGVERYTYRQDDIHRLEVRAHQVSPILRKEVGILEVAQHTQRCYNRQRHAELTLPLLGARSEQVRHSVVEDGCAEN